MIGLNVIFYLFGVLEDAMWIWRGVGDIAEGALPSQTGYVSAALFLGGFLMWSLSAMQMKKQSCKP